jgi:hypothetical protein
MPKWGKWGTKDLKEEVFLTNHDFQWDDKDLNNPDTETGALWKAIQDEALATAKHAFSSAGVLRIRGSKNNC